MPGRYLSCLVNINVIIKITVGYRCPCFFEFMNVFIFNEN